MVESFKLGLRKNSPFYNDLVMTPCRNSDEVGNRALRYIRLEYDKRIQDIISTSAKYAHSDKDQGSSYKNKDQGSSYENQNIHAVEEDEDDEEYPLISEYSFSVNTSGLMYAMQDLGSKARWPRMNDKSNSYKDKSKWCALHENFGHLEDECIALRRWIRYPLSRGHLKELLGKKKSRIQDPDKVPEKASPPPADAQVINFISEGSDICGTSFSAAKRHVKETKLEKGDRPIRTSTLTNQRIISFDEEDRLDFQDPLHDG